MASGTIAYCTREDSAPPLFASFLANIAQKNPDAFIHPVVTNRIADGRNFAAKEMQGDWLMFLDPDMAYPPDIVQRLLKHEVDAVQVFCLRRHPPHQPILWPIDQYRPAQVPAGFPRLVEGVAQVGSGGTLYHRRVFDAIPEPWFEGQLGDEDTCFARKCVAAGFRLGVDMATTAGHLTPVYVWPEFIDGQWFIRYNMMNNECVRIPFPQGRVSAAEMIQRPELIGVGRSR